MIETKNVIFKKCGVLLKDNDLIEFNVSKTTNKPLDTIMI